MPVDSAKIREIIASSHVFPTRTKCCEKCAFRSGSPERSDPYGWIRLVEFWKEDGVPFFCHEGVPGHFAQKQGVELMRCAGMSAVEKMTIDQLCSLAQCPKEDR
jgi:hypothetical protein